MLNTPELKKNLISLGTLGSHGYCYISKGGVIKVTRGSMVVMKGKKLSNNIYRLLGTTIIYEAAIVVYELDTMILLHVRLGHMGEKDIMEFHKRNLLKGIQSCRLDFC